MKVILAAVDGSPEHALVLEKTARLAVQFEAAVHVVSVIDVACGWRAAVGGIFSEVSPRLKEETRAVLHQACTELNSFGVQCTTRASVGPVAREIARLARELSADLIVIGHRNLTWLDRLMDESVGVSLLACAPCSVLVVVSQEQ